MTRLFPILVSAKVRSHGSAISRIFWRIAAKDVPPFELAYQARVAIDRIRFAIRQGEAVVPDHPDLMEARMQLLDALDRLESAERHFQEHFHRKSSPLKEPIVEGVLHSGTGRSQRKHSADVCAAHPESRSRVRRNARIRSIHDAALSEPVSGGVRSPKSTMLPARVGISIAELHFVFATCQRELDARTFE